MIFIFSLVINEVMANPLGTTGAGEPEDRNEWVEIFNETDDTVSLEGFKISDGDAVDSLIPWDTFFPDPDPATGTVILPPGFYAVILDPEYTDSGNGENVMPYDFPSGCIILTVANTTIGDGLATTDPLFLLSPSGDTVDTYLYPQNPGDGISMERKNPYLGDFPENWAPSTDSTGSTPGRKNSVFESPGVYIEDFSYQDGEFVVVLVNTGPGEDTLSIYEDMNWDGEGDKKLWHSTISVEGTDTLRIKIPFEDGFYKVIAKTTSSSRSLWIKEGDPVPPVVINEIMPRSEVEWVEVYNKKDYPVFLSGFSLDGEEIPDVWVDSFLVLTEDKDLLFSIFGNIPSPVLEIPISLNDYGDSIIFSCEEMIFEKIKYEEAEVEISIERVNPDIEGDVPGNWGISASPEGGTPGRKNSLYTPVLPAEAHLSISPDPFVPGKERCVFVLNLPWVRNRVTLKVFDIEGRQVFSYNGTMGGGERYILWDGENAYPGIHIVYMVVEEDGGKGRFVEKKTLTVGGKR